MRWRPRLFTLHRDVGFICVGLTLAYGISGVAVNHRHDWNYNHRKVQTDHALGPARALLGIDPTTPAVAPPQLARQQQQRLVAALLRRLGREDSPRSVFWRGPRRLSLFFGEGDRDVVDYDPVTGTAIHEQKRDRFLLRQLNALHLNEPARIWTWIADAFAVALLFLAISGAVMVKGRHGLRGRGGWLLVLGLAIPLVALLLLGACSTQPPAPDATAGRPNATVDAARAVEAGPDVPRAARTRLPQRTGLRGGRKCGRCTSPHQLARALIWDILGACRAPRRCAPFRSAGSFPGRDVCA